MPRELVGIAQLQAEIAKESFQATTLPRLIAYAGHRMGWSVSKRSEPSVHGSGPGDIVGIALTGALTGRRQWNRQKYGNVELFLRSVIRSTLSNERQKATSQSWHELPEDTQDANFPPVSEVISKETRERIVSELGDVADEVVDAVDAGKAVPKNVRRRARSRLSRYKR